MPKDLDSILGALSLKAAPEQCLALLRYVDLLQRWNAVYNLTAVREREAMLTQHLADCLAVVQPLRRRVAQGRILDVGSGGGLPGIVLAIMLPALDVTCVDAVAKKAAFVQQAAGVLNLPNLHAAHARVESLIALPFELIVSRAFASLADFTALTRPLLPPSGLWMAMKGKSPAQEIAALPEAVEVFHVEHLSVPGLDAERCLVWMRARAETEASP